MRVFIFAILAAIVISLTSAVLVMAQDPARGSWVVWAEAQCPAGTHMDRPSQCMTHFESTWTVPPNPRPSSAFFSPWIGSDTTDNLNLIQPVNPWMGDSWSFYTEVFTWSPESNSNSQSYPTQAGNRLRGQMTFLGETQQAYRVVQTDLNTGSESSQVYHVQQEENGDYKKFTWLYTVFEKYAQCSDYPPSGKVTFEDIKVFCSGKQVYPKWTTHFFQNSCDFRAHVINNETISITWSTSDEAAPQAETNMQKNAKGLKKH